MKTAANLNSATGSVLGLAELIGISHGKMRTLIGHLCAAGLITSESSNKGTAFRFTDRGERVLNFTSADVGKSSVRCPLKPSDSIPLCPNNPAH